MLARRRLVKHTASSLLIADPICDPIDSALMTLSYFRIRYEITLISRYIYITIVADTSLPVGLSSLHEDQRLG